MIVQLLDLFLEGNKHDALTFARSSQPAQSQVDTFGWAQITKAN